MIVIQVHIIQTTCYVSSFPLFEALARTPAYWAAVLTTQMHHHLSAPDILLEISPGEFDIVAAMLPLGPSSSVWTANEMVSQFSNPHWQMDTVWDGHWDGSDWIPSNLCGETNPDDIEWSPAKALNFTTASDQLMKVTYDNKYGSVHVHQRFIENEKLNAEGQDASEHVEEAPCDGSGLLQGSAGDADNAAAEIKSADESDGEPDVGATAVKEDETHIAAAVPPTPRAVPPRNPPPPHLYVEGMPAPTRPEPALDKKRPGHSSGSAAGDVNDMKGCGKGASSSSAPRGGWHQNVSADDPTWCTGRFFSGYKIFVGDLDGHCSNDDVRNWCSEEAESRMAMVDCIDLHVSVASSSGQAQAIFTFTSVKSCEMAFNAFKQWWSKIRLDDGNVQWKQCIVRYMVQP